MTEKEEISVLNALWDTTTCQLGTGSFLKRNTIM